MAFTTETVSMTSCLYPPSPVPMFNGIPHLSAGSLNSTVNSVTLQKRIADMGFDTADFPSFVRSASQAPPTALLRCAVFLAKHYLFCPDAPVGDTASVVEFAGAAALPEAVACGDSPSRAASSRPFADLSTKSVSSATVTPELSSSGGHPSGDGRVAAARRPTLQPAAAATGSVPAGAAANDSTSSRETSGGFPIISPRDGGARVVRHHLARNTSSVFNQSVASQHALPVPRTVSHLTRRTDAAGFDSINDYIVVAELGAGSQGEVLLVMDSRTGENAAMKVVRRQRFMRRRSIITADFGAARKASHSFDASSTSTAPSPATTPVSHLSHVQREVAVMKRLRHNNIVHLQEVIDDVSSNRVFIVMEFVDGGSIDRLAPIPHLQLGGYLRQACAGLAYLHRHGIVHRDIKPANLLCTLDGIVKLVDFGTSEMSETDALCGAVGTPVFMAPELWNGSAEVCGTATDVWSLGVTMYYLLHGKLPFDASTRTELVMKVQEADPVFDQAVCPAAWEDLLRGTLEKDPMKRLTVEQIRGHPVTALARRLSQQEHSGDTLVFDSPGHSQCVGEEASPLMARSPTEREMRSAISLRFSQTPARRATERADDQLVPPAPVSTSVSPNHNNAPAPRLGSPLTSFLNSTEEPLLPLLASGPSPSVVSEAC